MILTKDFDLTFLAICIIQAVYFFQYRFEYGILPFSCLRKTQLVALKKYLFFGQLLHFFSLFHYFPQDVIGIKKISALACGLYVSDVIIIPLLCIMANFWAKMKILLS